MRDSRAMDLFDHEPVTDEELAKMPEAQRLRATLNRQLIEEARAARGEFEKANAHYSATWDAASAITPKDAERALGDLLEVGRLFEVSQAARKEAIDFMIDAASDNPPREGAPDGS